MATEESTTVADPTDGADISAQPDAGATQPAASAPDDPNTTTSEEPQAGATGDDNLAWLQNKGIDPTSPEALAKVAEMYRNAEKAMHESTSKASQLRDSLQAQAQTGEQPDPETVAAIAAEVQQLKTANNVNTFFASNPEAKALESAMTKIVTENPTLGQLVTQGYLSLDQLYAMAKGGDSTRETDLKTEGGKEALERVAETQRARANTGAATTSAMANSTVTKANFDDWYSGLSAEQRADPKNQSIVNSLLSA